MSDPQPLTAEDERLWRELAERDGPETWDAWDMRRMFALLDSERAALAAASSPEPVPSDDGAANFDAAIQRAFAGSGVEVRTSFTPTEPDETWWMVENETGGYWTGDGWTPDWSAGRRFPSQDEAAGAASEVGERIDGSPWHAVEHGWFSSPEPVPSEPDAG